MSIPNKTDLRAAERIVAGYDAVSDHISKAARNKTVVACATVIANEMQPLRDATDSVIMDIDRLLDKFCKAAHITGPVTAETFPADSMATRLWWMKHFLHTALDGKAPSQDELRKKAETAERQAAEHLIKVIEWHQGNTAEALGETLASAIKKLRIAMES